MIRNIFIQLFITSYYLKQEWLPYLWELLLTGTMLRSWHASSHLITVTREELLLDPFCR